MCIDLSVVIRLNVIHTAEKTDIFNFFSFDFFKIKRRGQLVIFFSEDTDREHLSAL